MTMLADHLEQINLSAKTIAELEFPPSRPFTNALLHNKEITALIRDPEIHERGLFSVQEFVQNGKSHPKDVSYASNHGSRRPTIQPDKQRQESAVARVLGAEMLTRIQQSSHHNHRGKGVDIEILLQGAEKLCDAFDVPGTMDRVQALRNKHRVVSTSVARYEAVVSEQQSSLKKYNASSGQEEQDQDTVMEHNDFDFEAEEQMIQELEMKKKALEAKVSAMEKDLGGLLK